MARSRLWLIPLLAILLAPPAALADHSKLDARARIALAGLRAGTSSQALLEQAAAVSADGQLDAFVVGPVTRAQLEAAGALVRTQAGDVFTVFLPESSVEAVAALPGVVAIRGAAPVELELDAGVPSTGADLLRGPGPGFTGLNGQGVLVGDVDSGVDYDHGDFENAAGLTRLVNLWDQTDAGGPNPPGFAYGSNWTSADIDADVAREVDTDGHGTHVLGIAGGDGSATGGSVPAFTYVGMAPGADLAMVKTNFMTTGVVDGVAHLFQVASALGRNAVVNLSLGSHYGPHDGTSAFEAGLSALCGPGRIIVKSAGNERGQARHAEVFAAGSGTSATMTVSGSSLNRAFAIDGYYEASEDLAVSITTPNGTVVGPVALGGLNAPHPGQATANGAVYLENGLTLTPAGDREVYIEVNVTTGTTMNGTWTFTFVPVALGAANGEVDLWRFFNSAGTTANFAVGNQAAEELVSEPGNAVELITVGSWTTKRYWTDCAGHYLNFTGAVNPGILSPFSSPGPTRDGRPKPDITAPGSAIASATTFDLAQSCPAGNSTLLPDGLQHRVNQGTSMASPHAAGAAALILQKYGAVTPAFVKSFLAARAVVDNTGPVWNKDWGNGKLFLGDMLDPTVQVLAPNGGESYLVGQAVSLQWNAADNAGVTAVDLLLSRNGTAGPFETIAAGVPNTGSHPWTAQNPTSFNCVLRVVASDAAGNSAGDDSDLPWAIYDQATSTLLTEFAAEPREAGIEVRWRFGDPSLFSDVTVQRAPAADGPWAVQPVELRERGDTQVALDGDVEAGATYWYRLSASREGRIETFGPIAATAGQPVAEFALGRVAPNPASGAARVDFAVPRECRVRLTVLDAQGREVAVLAEGLHRAGRYQATWSGELRNRPAPPGLYLVRLQTPERSFTRRAIVVR